MNTRYLLKVKLDEISSKKRWSMPRKTYAVVGVVVGLHCVVVGSIFLMHGCGTPAIDGGRGRDVVMPPAETPLTPTLTPTVFKPVLKPEPAAEPVREPVSVSKPVKPTAGGNTYVVQKGDCLSGIASRFGVTTSELMALNGLKSANKIYEKQNLALPAGASSKPLPAPAKKPAAAPAVAVAAPPEGTETYTVQNGDCLSKIAARCKTTTKALRDQNKLVGDRIQVGQKLIVPQGSGAAGSSIQPPASTPIAPAAPSAPAPAVVPAASAPTLKPMPPEQPETSFPHDVQFGQTLDDISAMYSVPVEKLMAVNNLKSKSIRQGMKLKIPQSR